MELGTPRLLAGAIAVAWLGSIAAGCGSGSTANTKPAFAWLSARPAPAGWPTARIPSGAAISYPPGWKRIAGDRGTATVALIGGSNRYLGYLNLTPRQGEETLDNWARFRVEHNREEGNHAVSTLAAASGRPLGPGRVSCVEDSYVTTTGAHYIEIACLDVGPRRSVVVVAAGPPQTWKQISPELERAISSLSV